MWKTWIITAWRNYIRYKSFSILNLAGLSLGIACILSIALFVQDEFLYDRFHHNADRIYRINANVTFGGQQTKYATTATPLAEAIRSDIPEAVETARLFNRQATIELITGDSTSLPDSKYLEDNFFFADPEILGILSFNFLNGNSTSALSNPNQLVISRRMAEKYFGSVAVAMGKQVLFEGTIPLEISGVFENFPHQSSFPIELIGHFENYFTIEPERVRSFLKQDWMYNPVTTLVLISDTQRAKNVQNGIQALNDKYGDDRVQQGVQYELQALPDIHLYSDISFTGSRDNLRNIYIFITIGVLILLIACINFINLATVHSLKRSREIGVRKVMGAMKHDIARQFLSESLMLVFLAVMIALAMVVVMLPSINMISGKHFTIDSLFDPAILALLVVVFLATGLMAGLYPSVYIARFNPIAALKGLKNSARDNSLLLRRALVIVQFSASVVLIITTLVIFQQMRFVREQPLGFQKEFMLTIPLFSYNMNAVLGGGVEANLRGRMNTFENDLSTNPSIEAVTVSSVLPGQGAIPALIITDRIRSEDNVFVPVVSVDYDFLETYKIQVVAGRNFSRETGTDHTEALIANEEATKLLGFEKPVLAIGQAVEVLGKKAFISGVIRNYNFEGLQQSVRPLLMEVGVSRFTTFSIRLDGSNVPASIESVKKIWDTHFPEKVFDYQFLNTQLEENYAREERFGKLINFFSLLAIFISSLGLFGLAAYVAYQKQKEAGIRKVLGASTSEVFFSLSKEFILLIFLAVLFAGPVGYWLSDQWLSGFAFRISIGIIPFAVSLASITLAVFITTALQTFKTASLNPIETLRNE